VINRDDPIVNSMSQSGRNIIGFSLHESQGVDFGLLETEGQTWLAEGEYPLLPIEQMKIVGMHNIANALAALALGSAMALPMSSMLSAIREYKGLPHRCRLVRQLNGVRWFNDSKATNVGASVAAINGLAGNGKIILIAGGVGKEQDFSELTPSLKASVKAVILMGVDADKIAQVIPAGVEQLKAKDMADAVKIAQDIALEGDNVLLSPACASFDMFSSYVERGNCFEQAVRGIAA
jgi:UDP-N-acetylmuramoylalanine--D-glutamate ligase